MTTFRTGSIYFNQIHKVGQKGARIFLAPHPTDPYNGIGYLNGGNCLGEFDLCTGKWKMSTDPLMDLLPDEATYEETENFSLFQVGKMYSCAGAPGSRTVVSIHGDGLMRVQDSQGILSRSFRSARTGKFLGFDRDDAIKLDRNNESYNSNLDLILDDVLPGVKMDTRKGTRKEDPSAERDRNHLEIIKAPVRFDQFRGFEVVSADAGQHPRLAQGSLQRSTGTTDYGKTEFVNPIYKE